MAASRFQSALRGLKPDGQKVLQLLEDHIAKNLATDVPVTTARVSYHPGDCAKKFPVTAPEQGRDIDDLLKDIKENILPYQTNWNHPKFMAYYPSSTSTAAILGDTLCAGLGNVGLQWYANPVGTELEVVVMDWLANLVLGGDGTHFLHSSGQGGGIIQGTAGEALVTVVAAARMAKLRELQQAGGQADSAYTSLIGQDDSFYETPEDTFHHPDTTKLVFYTSSHAHFCVPKACRVAGVRLRRVKPSIRSATGNYGLVPGDIAAVIEEDVQNGLIPAGIILNYGTTNTCGYDVIGGFQELKEKYNLWLHCDAAYAGPALLLPEKQGTIGAEIKEVCTSFNFNGSKWFMAGFDSAFLFVADRRLFTSTMGASAAFMMKAQAGDLYAPEFKDWSIPLGRRNRALRIWMVMSHFGTEGMHEFLRNGIFCADALRIALETRPDKYRLPVKTDLGLVCFQLLDREGRTSKKKKGKERPANKETHADLCEHLSEIGNFFIVPSELNGEPLIRVALGGVLTEPDHVEELFMEIERFTASASSLSDV